MEARRIEVQRDDPLIAKAAATYFPTSLSPTCKAQSASRKRRRSSTWDNEIPAALEFEDAFWIMKGGMWDGRTNVHEIYLRKLVPLDAYSTETARRYCPDRNYIGMVVSFQGKEYAVSAEELTIAYLGKSLAEEESEEEKG